MGGIAAEYRMDGTPVSALALDRVAAAMAHRGIDGTAAWREGNAGLAYAAFHTTGESAGERQPLESGDYSLVFDGRLDNRAELCAALDEPATGSDARLALAAYLRWSEECAARLLGDFAFILWDRPRRQLFAARDAMGVRPLYWHLAGTTFRAGSEFQQFFTTPEVAHEPNEGMVAEYLACALSTPDETLWKGVYRLLPGHWLVARDGQVRIRKFYDPDPKREIRYSTDAEYAEHFLELLREAVRCRLRSPHRAGILLSGGVDSSTVAAVAAQVSGGAPPETFSLVFPDLDCDESAYIAEVTRYCDLRSNRITCQDPPPAFYDEQARRYRDFPDYPNGAMCHPLRQAVRARGCRVALTGLGGDEWLMGSYYHYADLLGRLRIAEFARQVRGHARAAGDRFRWRTVLRFGVWPLLPGAIQRAGDRRLARNRVPAWIDAGLARRTSLEDRMRARPATLSFPTLAQRDIHEVLTSPWRVHSLEMEERAAAAHGIEQRHPLSDRRIFEFALALPEEQRWRGDQTKFVLRESMRGSLPERIRMRSGKAEFSPVFLRAFAGTGEVLNPEWVNVEQVRAQFAAMEAAYRSGDAGYARYTCPLWMVQGMHVWRRAVDQTTGLDSNGLVRAEAPALA